MLPDPTFGLLVGDEYTEKAVPLPRPTLSGWRNVRSGVSIWSGGPAIVPLPGGRRVIPGLTDLPAGESDGPADADVD